MKKLTIFFAFLLIAGMAIGQTFVNGDEGIFKDSVRISGDWISAVVSDSSTIAAGGSSDVVSASGLVDYVTKVINVSGGSNNITFAIVDGGDSLAITDAGGTLKVPIIGIAPDQSASNELQTIGKVGSTVTLSGGGGSFTDEVDDADASPLNEIQNLAQVLAAGNSAGTTNIDMNGQNVTGLATDPLDVGWNGLQEAAPKDAVWDFVSNFSTLDSVQTIGDSIYIHYGGDSLLVFVDQAIVTGNRTMTDANFLDLDMNTFFAVRDSQNNIRVMWGNFGDFFQTFTKSGLGTIGANNQTVFMNSTIVGGLIIDEFNGNAVFTDNRIGSFVVGIEYALDYQNVKTNDLSLIHTKAVKELIVDSLANFLNKNPIGAGDTVQVVNGGVQIGIPANVDSTAIGNEAVYNVSTGSSERLGISGSSPDFTGFSKGDYVRIEGLTGTDVVPDAFYAIQGQTEGGAGSPITAQTWVDIQGQNVICSGCTFVAYQNPNPSFDTVKVDDGAMTIDDSFQPGGRRIIINGVGTGWSPYDGYIDSILITNSNQTELPDGHYEVYSATPANIIVELITPTISSQTFTGDVKIILGNMDNFNNLFTSEDSLVAKGDFVAEGSVYLESLSQNASGSNVVIDPITGKLYSDTTELATLYELDTAKVNLRNEIAASGGSGGGGGIGASPSTEVIVYDDFLDSTGIAGRYGLNHWLNVTSDAGNTIEINDPAFTANDVFGSINMTGITSGAFQTELNLMTDLVCDEYDWELEIRWKTNNLTADLHPVLGLINGDFESPNTGVYIFNSFAGTAFGVTNSTGNSSVDFTTDFTGSWQKMKIVHTNSTGTVEFFVDDVSQGSTTSNIPPGANHRIVVGYFGDDAEPTADDGLTIDYVRYKATISR